MMKQFLLSTETLIQTNDSASANEIVSKGDSAECKLLEVRGPGNSYIIIEVLTNSYTTTKNSVKGICRKFGSEVLPSGSTNHHFERKGVFRVVSGENCPKDEDAATELAIEVGAEDVKIFKEADGVEVLEFICDIPDYSTVKKNLEAQDLNVSKAGLEYKPVTPAPLDKDSLEVVMKMYDKLEEKLDIEAIYDTIAHEQS